MRRVTVFLIQAVLAATPAVCAAADPSPQVRPEHAAQLQRYIHCDGFADGVRGVALDHRPADAEKWREVGLGERRERVSVMDGYRVIYSHARTFAFATLKAERSDSLKYREDRRIVTRYLEDMAARDDNVTLASFAERGFEGQTLTKKTLGGTTLALTQIFSDQDSVIVTIFFLNQLPQYRKFQTYAEFITLRDSFIQGFLQCVADKGRRPVALQ